MPKFRHQRKTGLVFRLVSESQPFFIFLCLMEHASPQLEDGYTRIANELLEAIIIYPFCAVELKIILFIIRKTYGWKKKTEIISYGAIARELKTDIRYVKRLINKLVSDRVIFKVRVGRQNLIGLNKNYKSWKLWLYQSEGKPPPIGLRLCLLESKPPPPGLWKTDNAGGGQATGVVVT